MDEDGEGGREGKGRGIFCGRAMPGSCFWRRRRGRRRRRRLPGGIGWSSIGRPACVRERARGLTASASHHLARPAPLVFACACGKMAFLSVENGFICLGGGLATWNLFVLVWSGTLVRLSWQGEYLAVAVGFSAATRYSRIRSRLLLHSITLFSRIKTPYIFFSYSLQSIILIPEFSSTSSAQSRHP